MIFDLFSRPRHEPSSLTGFSGNRIDRQSEKRDDESAARALRQPQARVLLLTDGGRMLLKHDGAGFDPHFSVTELSVFNVDQAALILLGDDKKGPLLAAQISVDSETLPVAIKAIDFRSIYVQGLLDSERAGALAQAAALLSWNATHRYCGRCGTETRSASGGYKRVCPNCGAEHFPRTDPVVIMLAVTPQRCLLGRSARFAPGMFSALAGFIEPGETIEDAVRRETHEEAGVRVGRVAYHASQPWPFPHSLMIGCYAEALNENIQADLTELEDCRWFTRDDTRAVLEGNHPQGIFAPPPAAIAHRLIRDWVDAT